MSDVSQRSTAELVGDIADDVRMLVRKELELARIEYTEAFSQKLKGAGLVAAAAIATLPGFLFLVVAAALWIPLSDAAGFAIVGGALLVLAAVAILVGIRMVRKPRKETGVAIDSIKEDVRWAREHLTR